MYSLRTHSFVRASVLETQSRFRENYARHRIFLSRLLSEKQTNSRVVGRFARFVPLSRGSRETFRVDGPLSTEFHSRSAGTIINISEAGGGGRWGRIPAS